MAVVTGALPAQYGLRTAGLVDIQSRMGTAAPSGEVSIYGGSHGTINTNVQYGGVSGDTQYFFTGRWLQNNLGIRIQLRVTTPFTTKQSRRNFSAMFRRCFRIIRAGPL